MQVDNRAELKNNMPLTSRVSTRSKPELTIETITPAMAEEMLRNNTKNRPIRESNVTFLTNEILSGNWSLTGETIQFVGKRLIDGQHRLKAVIAANKSIQCIICRFPVTPETEQIFEKIDLGSVRTASDRLAMDGQTNIHVLGGVVKAVDRYYVAIQQAEASALTIPYSSQTHAANRTLKTIQKGGRTTFKQPLSHIMLLLQKYPFSSESTAYGVSVCKRKPKILTPTQWGLIHYIFNDVDEINASDFLTSLLTGENLTRQSPILQLRERLLSARSELSKNNGVVGSQLVLCLCNAAWNAYRTGKAVNLKRKRTN